MIFPNTVPPFFPTGRSWRRPPSADDFELRLAGLRAHNRWLADWCAEHPERRAGIGQIFLNDVDEAIADVRWIKEHGLRGGILDARGAARRHAHRPALLADVRPAVGGVRGARRAWSTSHSRQRPTRLRQAHGRADVVCAHRDRVLRPPARCGTCSLSGVFERFPGLRFVLTEQGCAWIPSTLAQLDGFHEQMTGPGASASCKFDAGNMLRGCRASTSRSNCWVGASFPGPTEAEVAATSIGLDRFMWGSDYPHNEGTYPYTRERLRPVVPRPMPEPSSNRCSPATPAAVYDFDLEQLARSPRRSGPTVAEIAVPLDADPGRLREPGVHTLTFPPPRPTSKGHGLLAGKARARHRRRRNRHRVRGRQALPGGGRAGRDHRQARASARRGRRALGVHPACRAT